MVQHSSLKIPLGLDVTKKTGLCDSFVALESIPGFASLQSFDPSKLFILIQLQFLCL